MKSEWCGVSAFLPYPSGRLTLETTETKTNASEGEVHETLLRRGTSYTNVVPDEPQSNEERRSGRDARHDWCMRVQRLSNLQTMQGRSLGWNP